MDYVIEYMKLILNWVGVTLELLALLQGIQELPLLRVIWGVELKYLVLEASE